MRYREFIVSPDRIADRFDVNKCETLVSETGAGNRGVLCTHYLHAYCHYVSYVSTTTTTMSTSTAYLIALIAWSRIRNKGWLFMDKEQTRSLSSVGQTWQNFGIRRTLDEREMRIRRRLRVDWKSG